MKSDAVEFIAQSIWGSALSEEQRDRVISRARDITVPEGGHIFHHGEKALYWVGLMRGEAVHQVSSADGKAAALTVAGAGSWFGEGTLMREGQWRYDAVARHASRVVLVPLAEFQWLCQTSLAFNQFLAKLLNDRLGHYIGLLSNDRLANPEARIARVIASFYDPGMAIDRAALVPFSQTDIAALSGMSRQRTNEALQKLQSAGLLALGRFGIKVLDLDRLRDF